MKSAISLWISLRLQLLGYSLSIANTLYPVMQYFKFLPPQSAALVGFSIHYGSSVNGIIQDMIFNFSDMEMQLVSVERLREYANGDPQAQQYATARQGATGATG